VRERPDALFVVSIPKPAAWWATEPTFADAFRQVGI